MTSNADLMALLNDIEKLSEESSFPEAKGLIAKARAAIKEDFVHQSPKLEALNSTQRLI